GSCARRLLSARLPAREAMGRRRGELFPSQSWAPPPPKPAPAVADAPPPAPTPPPMPYRVAGRVVHDGVAHVVLAKGDRVLTVRQGDTLDDGYRVEAIAPRGVTLVYLPLNVPQQLPVAVALEDMQPTPEAKQPIIADKRPATLRLEGPARIRAGDRFSVSLKVTSDQAVRSAPVQLSFDAALLEPVDVRRGGFFADGIFSFRINPSGSIFIGAAGKGEVPADAEFFVVTFKPVRAGAAELKLSSVLLQGAAGRAIAHDQPAAFRTSIVQ
ncbi:MAG TPA: cohesin domain-containing protein, partial [Burkholderiales bacterium]|nr:cohesin domain-containing protein [Burkholderiales bacterium]